MARIDSIEFRSATGILPCHHRQVAMVAPRLWRAWFGHEAADAAVLRPSPVGSPAVPPPTLPAGA